MIRQYYTLKSAICGNNLKIYDTLDPRDRIVKSFNASGNSVDLSKFVQEQKHQSDTNSCGSHAGISWYEMMINMIDPSFMKSERMKHGFSEMHHYYCARHLNGSFPKDAGMTVRDIFKTIHQIGCTPEVFHPDRWWNLNSEPHIMADIFCNLIRKKFELEEYFRISSATKLKSCILSKLPAVIGVRLFKNCIDDKTGQLSMPEKDKSIGGHAILITGYEDGVFKFLNSWGTRWGVAGFGYVSEEYVRDYELGMWSGKVKIHGA